MEVHRLRGRCRAWVCPGSRHRRRHTADALSLRHRHILETLEAKPVVTTEAFATICCENPLAQLLDKPPVLC
jgi:hypothetical protein